MIKVCFVVFIFEPLTRVTQPVPAKNLLLIIPTVFRVGTSKEGCVGVSPLNNFHPGLLFSSLTPLIIPPKKLQKT